MQWGENETHETTYARPRTTARSSPLRDARPVNLVAAFVAAFGLGLAAYAAMETEPEDIRRRAAYGVLGMLLLVAGVVLL
jgi:hypothetical protein